MKKLDNTFTVTGAGIYYPNLEDMEWEIKENVARGIKNGKNKTK